MPLRRRVGLVISSAGAAIALLLSGCDLELNAPPEPDLSRIESVWDIKVPPGTEVLEYYSSEVDFTGVETMYTSYSYPLQSAREFGIPQRILKGSRATDRQG